jgi:hypothetical protein
MQFVENMHHRSPLWSMADLICNSVINEENTEELTVAYRVYRITGERKISANRRGSDDTSEPSGYCG